MFCKAITLTAVLIAGLAASAADAQTPLGNDFTYQGQLTLSGGPLNDTADFEFSLWDDAGTGEPPTGGTQIGLTQTVTNVTVVDGLFTVQLDFGVMAFNGDARWLQIAVRSPHDPGDTAPYTTLSPRQPLTAAPYALFALNGGGTGDGHSLDAADGDPVDAVFVNDGGNVGIGTTAPSERLDISDGDANSALRVAATNLGPQLIYKAHQGGTKDLHVVFEDAGGAQTEVMTLKGNGNTGNVGIGETNPAYPLHVISTNTAPAMQGENGSQTGVAVRGRATHGTGTNVGVWGESAGHTGVGVRGLTTHNTGSTTAIWGETASSSGKGVRGRATRQTGNNVGVLGESFSNSGVGVCGFADAGSGITFGVCGHVESGDGFAGYFTGGRNFFQGRVGIGTTDPVGRLVVATGSSSEKVVNIQRLDEAVQFSKMLLLQALLASSDEMQFIECDRGGDIKFRVWGDGDVTADGTFSSPADFAEMIRVTDGPDSVEPGDVMVIDVSGSRAVVKSTTARSTLVAGVYSTKPGVLGSEHDWDDVARELGHDPTSDSPQTESLKPQELGRRIGEVPVAVVGIVPCKVSAENGPIMPGDLLVTAATPGHAMFDENPRVGTVIGKALEPLESGRGVIRVLVTLQ
jgi:hypothetical protein